MFALESFQPERFTTLPHLGHTETAGAIIARSDDLALPAFEVFVKGEDYDTAVRRLDELGAIQGSTELFEALRSKPAALCSAST